MGIANAVAFGASVIQSAFCAPFFLAFVHKIYLEGMRMDRDHMGELLAPSIFLGRHTSVIILTRQGTSHPAETLGPLQQHEYVWSHPTIRPFGVELPVQCPLCGSLASLRCRATEELVRVRCGSKNCSFVHTYSRPPGLTMIKSGEGGQWVERFGT